MNIGHNFSIIKENYLDKALYLLCILYILVAFLLTPLYKFGEVYLLYPKINFSAVRLLILLTTIFVSMFLVISHDYKLTFFKPILKLLGFPILCIFSISVMIIVSYPFITSYSYNATDQFLLRVDAVISGYTMMFISGLYVDKWRTYSVFLVSWIIYVAFLLWNFDYLFASYFTYKVTKAVNYILLADSLAFLAIFVIFESKSLWTKFFVWVTTFSVLFITPSRTTFVCFIVCTIFIFLKNVRLLIFLSFFSLVSILILRNSNQMNNTLFTSSRILKTDLKKDASLAERRLQSEINYDNFKESWVLGDFMGDVRLFNGADGNYTHTYFSIWEQFGILPFFLFLMSVIILMYYLYKLYFITQDGIFLSTVSLTIFTLIAISFSRSFHNPFIWFLISRVLVLYYSKKNQQCKI
ncbi:MAG: hypothetical protein IPK35_18245 [Saprospiraceae bacterium]|nr:hypothetical protein [Saprospiraceae bacterium]